MPDVLHQPDWHRFAINFENGTEARLEYRRDGDEIVFTHTEVPPQYEGEGIGGKLAQAGLNYARENHLTVVPRCPFVASYLKRHGEYADIVDPHYR